MESEHPLTLQLTERDRRALRYCTYCPRMCRFACPVAHGEARETVTPWGLMRLLNLVDRGDVEPGTDVLEVLNHCVSCGRCTTFCKHENPVAEVLAKGRAQLVASGLEVPKAWQVEKGGCQAKFFMAATNPGRTDLPAFLPSCSHLASIKTAEALKAGVLALERAGMAVSIPARGKTAGCGYHEWEVGKVDEAKDSWAAFIGLASGHSVRMTDCAPALWALSDGSDGVMHLVEWLAEHLDQLPEGDGERRVALHDSCFVTRRLKLGDDVRAVVTRLAGRAPVELFESGDSARCCGSNGLWADVRPEARHEATAAVVADIADIEADLIVTSSPSCRNNIAEQVDEAGLTGPSGAPVVVVDLLGLLAL